MEKYKVTLKRIYCDARCSNFSRHILDCIENCNSGYGKDVFEETEIMSIDQLIQTINEGNCIITKVEEL